MGLTAAAARPIRGGPPCLSYRRRHPPSFMAKAGERQDRGAAIRLFDKTVTIASMTASTN